MSEPANVWITRVDDGALAAALDEVDPSLPLAGTTVAVKDNIDVAGLATTAACPAFAYRAERDAPVVARLTSAGAVVAGKTNMDQFATGLNGTRSPYGICRSVLDPARISGGSSSGSAVAVAAGLADVALGTDTAGSGRVPAACNGIVGYKPTPGLLAVEGIVPACRSLDCPSLFTRTVGEARRFLDVLAPDAPTNHFDVRSGLRIATPDEAGLARLGPAARSAFEATVARLRAAGAEVGVVAFSPFAAAGDLLYGGAWVAERYHAVGRFIEQHPDEVHPVVREVVLAGRALSAGDVFADRDRLRTHAAEARASLEGFDALVVPTVADVPTVEAVLADPIAANLRLGAYTSFVNLLGFAAVAVPGAPRADGVPSGVTVVTAGGRDHLALDVASLVEGEAFERRIPDGRVPLAVVGAHLEGQPLHHQLADRGATLVARTTTSPSYLLHALDTEPAKPGLERVDAGRGRRIEVEVWSLDRAAFGSFVSEVPPPLAIGKVELEDGSWVPGFVCESIALRGARDITASGGWRRHLTDSAGSADGDRTLRRAAPRSHR